ncbi:LysR family transcriptional regulator substrate-binding protein [Streptomyces sp. NPDC056390]|uniref:LysR family transcriptional regulator substrate-binding protein n=1 Tax=Streptomyces sp. NPDC056390 TaxID=3345806 RepID=UPI0035DA47F8
MKACRTLHGPARVCGSAGPCKERCSCQERSWRPYGQHSAGACRTRPPATRAGCAVETDPRCEEGGPGTSGPAPSRGTPSSCWSRPVTPWPTGRRVRLRDIAAETFGDMPEEFGQRQLADDAFTKAELSRRVVIEVSDITTIAEYVAHGIGVALLAPDLAERAGETVRAVPLADVRLAWTLSVVASATRPPTRALHAFLDLISHHIRRDRVL